LTIHSGKFANMTAFSSSPDAAPALFSSVEWVRDLLTGSIGTSIAVLAIAWLGFALLQGRIPVRAGARVVLGCFILFGSPVIAAAFLQMAHPEPTEPTAMATQVAPPTILLPSHPPQFDPYAGASVPNH
jgi:type IV secretory pathway VirB2 component (pilin)